MRTLFKRVVMDDVPPEMDMCLDCRVLRCSEEKFQTCAARKLRAEELTHRPQRLSGMTPRRRPSAS
jgi:hypothetical protein